MSRSPSGVRHDPASHAATPSSQAAPWFVPRMTTVSGASAGVATRRQAAAATIHRDRPYVPREAVEAVKATAFAKFDETVDIAVRLAVDPRHADQIVRGTVVLPHGVGKTVRVLALAQGEKAKEAEAAGADLVGPEYIQKIKDGWLDCDVIVATPDMMGVVGRLGRVLGPRGLMPNPKLGTVTQDVATAIKSTPSASPIKRPKCKLKRAKRSSQSLDGGVC